MQFKQLVSLKNIQINQLEVEHWKSFPSGSGRMRVSRACYIVSSKHMYSDAPLSDCTLLSHSTTKAQSVVGRRVQLRTEEILFVQRSSHATTESHCAAWTQQLSRPSHVQGSDLAQMFYLHCKHQFRRCKDGLRATSGTSTHSASQIHCYDDTAMLQSLYWQ